MLGEVSALDSYHPVCIIQLGSLELNLEPDQSQQPISTHQRLRLPVTSLAQHNSGTLGSHRSSSDLDNITRQPHRHP